MKAPLVSILVPIYNGERFLRECLDSILAQEYSNLEILLADDGSQDGSTAMLTEYAARDPRIRWWNNRQNLGLVENWNGLLQAARGEYVKFIFQDDKLLSASAVSRMVQALEEHPTAVLAASASHVIDDHSQIIELRDHFEPGLSLGQQIVIRCLAKNGNLIGEPSVVMFRRSSAGTGFDSRYHQLVDLEFFFRLLEQGDFVYISETLTAFRRHAGQATARNNRTGEADREHFWLMQQWFAKPFVVPEITREMQFNLIRSCNKNQTPEGQACKESVMRRLGRGWYLACWLKRKITSTFRSLFRRKNPIGRRRLQNPSSEFGA